MRKELGKIESVSFGHGGYQGCMLGLHVTLSSGGWSVGDTRSTWDANLIECSSNAKWTEDDRSKQYDDIMRYTSKLLNDAKVHTIDKLKGIPVEVSFEGNTLKEWRVLTEVL